MKEQQTNQTTTNSNNAEEQQRDPNQNKTKSRKIDRAIQAKTKRLIQTISQNQNNKNKHKKCKCTIQRNTKQQQNTFAKTTTQREPTKIQKHKSSF